MTTEAKPVVAQSSAKNPLARCRNYIFVEPNNFIFAFVPKVACTNWKSVLRYLMGHKDYLDNQLAHDRKRGGLRYLDLDGPDLAILQDAGIRKFTFVRDPYTRALSGYLNKVEKRLAMVNAPENGDHFLKVTKEIDRFRQEKLDMARYPATNFEVFLLFLLQSGSYLRNDEHWQTQTALLGWPHVAFDFIGRFERLEDDARTLLGLMGCDIPFPTHAEVRFPATGATDKLATYLTSDCAGLIEEIYAEDFKNLNYAKR
jgi:Sulfotransferase family